MGLESHPLACTHPERYALRHLDSGSDNARKEEDRSLRDGSDLQEAHLLQTHEAALRAAIALH